MNTLFIDKNSISGAEVEVTGDDCRHLQVLRMNGGDVLTVSDGEFVFDGVIDRMTPHSVYLKLSDKRPVFSEPSVSITLYQALCKGEKNEQIIQKSVELGVNKIVFFISSNCVARPDGRENTKLERFAKISKMAAMQSGRQVIPEVCGFRSFDRIFDGDDSDMTMFFYENATRLLSSSVSGTDLRGKKINIVIGSEGGFTPAEANLAATHGTELISLGKRILRAETASSAVISALMAFCGEM